MCRFPNNTEYELISAVVNTGNELALIEHWKPGETIDLETEQQNGRVHMMTKDQFSEGAYKNRGQWIGKLADYYEYYSVLFTSVPKTPDAFSSTVPVIVPIPEILFPSAKQREEKAVRFSKDKSVCSLEKSNDTTRFALTVPFCVPLPQ